MLRKATTFAAMLCFQECGCCVQWTLRDQILSPYDCSTVAELSKWLRAETTPAVSHFSQTPLVFRLQGRTRTRCGAASTTILRRGSRQLDCISRNPCCISMVWFLFCCLLCYRLLCVLSGVGKLHQPLCCHAFCPVLDYRTPLQA